MLNDLFYMVGIVKDTVCDFIYDRMLALVVVFVIIVIFLIAFGAHANHQNHLNFMAECEQHRDRYECLSMWRR